MSYRNLANILSETIDSVSITSASNAISIANTSSSNDASYALDLSGELAALNATKGTGFLAHTAANAYTYRGLVAATAPALAGVSISNGDGVAGNPTIGFDIASLPVFNTATQAIVYTNASVQVLMYDGTTTQRINLMNLATPANIGSTIVRRSANGSIQAAFVEASGFSGFLSGTASRANVLSNARTLSLTGDATASWTFDGSADVASALTLANTGVGAGSYGSASTTLSATVDAKGRLTALAAQAIAIPSSAITDATSAATPNTVAKRDANGSLVANVVTATSFVGALTGNVSGNAGTATKLATPRTFTFGDAVTGALVFDGSSDVSVSMTLANSGVVAGTYGLGTTIVDRTGRILGISSYPIQGTANQIGVVNGAALNANPTISLAANTVIPGTGALTIPVGLQSERPAGAAGQMRYNSNSANYEAYFPATSRWQAVNMSKTRYFSASSFDNPAPSADWSYVNVAPAQADPVTTSLVVRAFDDTLQEAIGITVFVPPGTTVILMRWRARCATAPTSSSNNVAQIVIPYRQYPANAAATAWGTLVSVGNTFALNNQWQYFTQTITVTGAAGTIQPGSLTQVQFARIGNNAADTLVGDMYLADIMFEFS